MREKQEAQEGERCFTTFDKADGDVAFTSNVAEANESGAGSFKNKEAQVEVCEETVHVEREATNMQEEDPNNNKGLSICTPPQHKHPFGPNLQNNIGGYGSSCMVYTRKRWFQKKTAAGQPSSTKATPMRLDKSQTQHLQREVQRETAAMSHNYSTTQEANYSTTQEAALNEDIQETDELLHFQEASDI